MTRRVRNGYIITIDGRPVLIRRLVPSKRDRREYGLPAVLWDNDASIHTTLRASIAEARELVHAEQVNNSAAKIISHPIAEQISSRPRLKDHAFAGRLDERVIGSNGWNKTSPSRSTAAASSARTASARSGCRRSQQHRSASIVAGASAVLVTAQANLNLERSTSRRSEVRR